MLWRVWCKSPLNLFKALKNRREFYRLGDMSDAELADIGLTRADLHVVHGDPIGTDPTTTLGLIVRRRAEDEEAAARSVGADSKPLPAGVPASYRLPPVACRLPGPERAGLFRCADAICPWPTAANDGSFRAVAATRHG